MQGYEPPTYGERIADVYDELYDEMFDKAGTVAFLKERAKGGPALELAIGTGRTALPLREEGVEVHGIDISEEMVAKLRAKAGGEDVPVTMGDFAEVAVDGTYPLVYVVFNTFFALTTQEDQIRCLQNAAAHLADDGLLVMEAFVPDVTRFKRHQNTEVADVDTDFFHLSVSRHDPVSQTIRTQNMIVTEKETKLLSVFLRYAYPPEIDVMARLAGLALRERYEDWRMNLFHSDSKTHVSVYGKA